MERDINKHLNNWKNEFPRKALLVRGARQVGKTYSICELGKTFNHFFEVNFEEEPEVKKFFTSSLNPNVICRKLSAYYALPIIPNETLLFFDEIQACPQALSSLRFFYEKMPELHVIAAGSLLEFVLSELPSQGVGRIHSLFMYPMSFDEFLTANGEKLLLAIKGKADAKNPIDDPFHHKLIDYLKVFYLIGGMPASVKDYIVHKDISRCQSILNDIIESLRDDFAKYKKRSPVRRLQEVFDSICLQAGSKFKFSNVESVSSHRPLKDALDMIIQSGLAHKIYHSSCQGLPLGAGVNIKKFKVIMNDTGIQQKILGLSVSDMIKAEEFTAINKGGVAEVFVGLEMIKNLPPSSRAQLYYWHKETRGSNSEVDYVVQKGRGVIPIEVKSGSQGKMQSLHIFIKEHKIDRGIRVSLENFSSYGNIEVYPLYAVANILKSD